MNDLNLIFSYGFFEARLFDLPNFLICIVTVLLLGKINKVSVSTQLVLVVHCFLPFILNQVLFEVSYMPDQFKYWRVFNLIRSGDFSAVSNYTSSTIVAASYFFSVLPFPNAAGPWSLGFYNAFLYVVLFFWLHSKKVFTPLSRNFYLFFPSFALYSSLGLRDTFIIFFMVFSIQFARENKKLFMLLSSIPLYFIKFQNFFILVPLMIIYSVFKVAKKGMTLLRGSVISFIGVLLILASAPIALPLVNQYRASMFAEDGGDPSDLTLISGVGDFIFQGLTSFIYFLSKPLPWEATSFFQLVQSLENLFVLVILYLVTKQAWKKDLKKLIFWMLFMVLAMSIYGLVVANYGTAVRYRYPFVVIYILFVCSDCNIQRLFPKKNKVSSGNGAG